MLITLLRPFKIINRQILMPAETIRVAVVRVYLYRPCKSFDRSLAFFLEAIEVPSHRPGLWAVIRLLQAAVEEVAEIRSTFLVPKRRAVDIDIIYPLGLVTVRLLEHVDRCCEVVALEVALGQLTEDPPRLQLMRGEQVELLNSLLSFKPREGLIRAPNLTQKLA
jgi:hypothetical protein